MAALDDLEKAVYTTMGEAGTCWSNVDGAGVFDSTRAQLLGRKLLAEIARLSDLAALEALPTSRDPEEIERWLASS